MSEAEQHNDQSRLKISSHQQEAQVSEQKTEQSQVVNVNSSEQFQDMEVSHSQNITSSFDEFKEYLASQKHQIPHDNTEHHSENQQQEKKPIQVQQSIEQTVQDKIETQNQQYQANNNSENEVQVISTQTGVTNQPTEEGQTVQNRQQTKPKNSIEQPQKPQARQVNFEGLISLKIFEAKINQSLQFKNQGNEFFKTNQYEDAIKKYSEGLRILDPKQFYGATQAQCQKMAQVSASLLFNIGSCFYNLSIWRNAQIYFTETITINPNHIKAIYKRSLCRYEMQNYEGAMNDIKQAFNMDKSNIQVHRSYEKIIEKYNEQVKKEKESLKQISSKIFRKDSQKSLAQSQKSQNLENDEQKEAEKEEKGQKDEQKSDFWGFAPLILVAGAALFMGYKKWFSN